MLLFVAGFLCMQLGLGMLAGLIYAAAGKIMLLAFGLLLLLGAVALIVGLLRELRVYFRQEASALRRVLTAHTQNSHVAQQTAQKRRQLNYLTLFKRQRLLAADNRKQLRALNNGIDRELQAARTQLSAASYRDMSKALRNYRKQADAEAMLALRQGIPFR